MPKINRIQKFLFGNKASRLDEKRNTSEQKLQYKSRQLQLIGIKRNLGLPIKRGFFKQNLTTDKINAEKIKLRLTAIEYILHGMIEIIDLNRIYLKKLVRLNNGKMTKIERKLINSSVKTSEKFFEKAARARYTDKQLWLDDSK